MTNVGCYLGNVNSSVMFIFTCDSEKWTKFLKKLKKTAKRGSNLWPRTIKSVTLTSVVLRWPWPLNDTIYSSCFATYHNNIYYLSQREGYNLYTHNAHNVFMMSGPPPRSSNSFEIWNSFWHFSLKILFSQFQ